MNLQFDPGAVKQQPLATWQWLTKSNLSDKFSTLSKSDHSFTRLEMSPCMHHICFWLLDVMDQLLSGNFNGNIYFKEQIESTTDVYCIPTYFTDTTIHVSSADGDVQLP